MWKLGLLVFMLLAGRAFGQTTAELAADVALMKKVIALQQDRIKILDNQKFYFKTKKFTPATPGAAGDVKFSATDANAATLTYELTQLGFSNLTVGKTYQYKFSLDYICWGPFAMRWEAQSELSGGTVLFKGEGQLLSDPYNGGFNAYRNMNGSVTFVAPATKVMLKLRPMYYNPLWGPMSGPTTFYLANGFATLVEVPDNYIEVDKAGAPTKNW